MSRLPVRLSLLVLCLAAIAAAGFFLWTSNRATQDDAGALRRFELEAHALALNIADLRAAQQSYVAAGQGPDFWFARVDALRGDLDSRLSALRSSATVPSAITELETASTALQDFAQMDLRARDYTRDRQVTLASDMVFADGFELTKKAGNAVDRALVAEQSGRDAAAGATRRRQVAALAGAGSIAFLGLLLLVPGRRRTEAAALPAPVPAVVPSPRHEMSDLDEMRPIVRPAVPQPKPAPPPTSVVRPAVDLQRVAALCADFARIPDGRTLPQLLGRAAELLDASGIIVWIADPDGRELTPILLHGYPPQLATRLGNIGRDAANVTASAYRTGLLQTMKGDATSSGAIAVPLVASNGCVGVMAAEVKNGGEQQESLLAAAAIIAAQLSTLVGPPAARTRTEAAG
jgi:hypothetical protein